MDRLQQEFLDRLEKHRGILHQIARAYQADPDDRRDLLQEMQLQLWQSYGSFGGESAFSTWMYRVALNTAIGFYKKKQRWQSVNAGEPYPDLPEELRPPGDESEQLEIFYRALQQLNKIDKALIILYMEGRSGQETAEILGINPGNARVKLTRVKEKLKYIIKTMGYDF